jgi:hypothetical protein
MSDASGQPGNIPGAGLELIGGEEVIERAETTGNLANDEGMLLRLAAFAIMDVTVDADLNMMCVCECVMASDTGLVWFQKGPGSR